MANVTVVIRVDGERKKIIHSARWHQVTHVLPGDTVSWACEGAAFRVSEIVHDCGDGCKAHPPHPFRKAIDHEIFAAGESKTSLRVVEGASGGKYKSNWEIFKDESGKELWDRLDPHIYVGP